MSCFLSLTGLSPSLAGFPKTFLLESMNQFRGPNPGVHALRFGLFPFRSPLLWKSMFLSSSSGYLDVSVHRVPFHTLWIGVWMHEGYSCRFPHSDICGSMDICSSPQLFAAYHVFRRLLVPRHPPCALVCLTSFLSFYSVRNWVFCVKNAFPIIFDFELSFLVFSDVLIKYISSKSLYEVFKVQSSTLCVAIRNCTAISVCFKILGICLKHFQILLTVLSVIRNFNLLKSLITHKTILFYNPAATCFPIPSPV